MFAKQLKMHLIRPVWAKMRSCAVGLHPPSIGSVGTLPPCPGGAPGVLRDAFGCRVVWRGVWRVVRVVDVSCASCVAPVPPLPPTGPDPDLPPI